MKNERAWKWYPRLRLPTVALLGLLPSTTRATGDQNWDSAFGVPGANGPVWAIIVRGQEIYVGGSFTQIGGISANNVARWDGTNWMALGEGLTGGALPEIHAFEFLGGFLYAGGFFTQAGGVETTGIAKWDGANWSGLNGGVSGGVRALVAANGALFVGGTFSWAGPLAVQNIARWDGTNWASVGDIVGAAVDSLAAGSGRVYAGGRFTAAGGVSATNIVKWNGTNWSALGSGIRSSTRDGGGNAIVRALLVKDNNLYAGGAFRSAGDAGTTNIAKWDGTNWWPLGAGIDISGELYALSIFDAGVLTGGFFSTAGGQTARSIAKWDGAQWFPIGTGVLYGPGSGAANAIARSGDELFVGGVFERAGGKPSVNIARWYIPHALKIDCGVDQAVVSWETTGSNFVLECSAEILGPNWTQVPQSPVLVGDQLVVTNQLDGASRFYRLRRK